MRPILGVLWAAAALAAMPQAPLESLGQRLPPPPLSAQARDQIVAHFQEAVPRIFGDNLSFAFVCGSVAGRYALVGHDIDTMVVLRRDDSGQRAQFVAWLRQLHREAGMVIDDAYPAEVLTESQLEAALAALAATSLSLDFNTIETFDRVTWADMLAGDRAGEVGDRAALAQAAGQAAPHIARWHQALLAAVRAHGLDSVLARRYLTETVPRPEIADLAKLPLPRLIRRLVPMPEQAPPPGTSPLAQAMLRQPELLSPRLVLSPLRAGDAEVVWAASRRLRHIRPGEALPAPLANRAAANTWIRAQLERAARGGNVAWVLRPRGGGEPLGLAGFRPLASDPTQVAVEVLILPRGEGDGGRDLLAQEARGRLAALAAGPLALTVVP